MATKQQIQSINPYKFEELVAELWEAKGYTTLVRKKSGDRGVDIEAERGGLKEVIQVKRYSSDNKIGSREVRKYATLYQQTDANQVVLVTSGDVTNEAQDLSSELGVEIVDGEELLQQFKQYSIQIPTDTQSTEVSTTDTQSTEVSTTDTQSTEVSTTDTHNTSDANEKSITGSKIVKAVGYHIFGWIILIFVLAIIGLVFGVEEGTSGFDLLIETGFLIAGIFTATFASMDKESPRYGTWLLAILYIYTLLHMIMS